MRLLVPLFLRKLFALLPAILGAVWVFAPVPLRAQLEPVVEDSGWAGLDLALRRLQTTRSVLFVTAHPDDENNALLAYLSLGQGHRVGVLALTRGAGGQNEIGPELGDALAILRTEELLAVHRHDKVEQRFGRVVDFGYSFSVDETLEKWDREQSLEDIVRVVREFRPDVLMTMRPDGVGGGQHHQTSARLAEEAFEVSGDSERFPQHLAEGLRPWKPRQLYRVPFRLLEGEEKRALAVPVGHFDMALGKSYAEFGAAVRNLHRSQGMNAPPLLSGDPAWVLPVVPAELRVLFEGLPPGLETLAAMWKAPAPPPDELDGLVRLSREAALSFRRGDLASSTARIMEGLGALTRLEAELATREGPAWDELRVLLAHEKNDWLEAAEVSHQFVCEALIHVADVGRTSPTVDGLVTAGETFFVQTTLVQRAAKPAFVRAVRVLAPAGWNVEQVAGETGELEASRAHSWVHRVTVPPDATVTQPFWRRPSLRATRYVTAPRVDGIPRPREASLPFLPPLVRVEIEYVAGRVGAVLSRPVVHRWYDPRAGVHRNHALRVVPGLSVSVEEPDVILRNPQAPQPRQVTVSVRNLFPRPVSARIELRVPPRWRFEPRHVDVDLERENVEQRVRFELTPPATIDAGEYKVQALASTAGKTYTQGYRVVAYHHVQTRHAFREAEVTLRAFDVRVAEGLRVGYVMGVGDEVPAAISKLGAEVRLVDEDALGRGDLAQFDTIVLGIRAYKDREDLQRHNHRLLEYVHDGGVLVVQYNKYEFHRNAYAPYPCSIHRPHDRVTDENSAVRILQPDHPVFHNPNLLTSADWDGWIQERGLYFLGTWDAHYTPLLELADPFPYNSGAKRGALVVAQYGKGLYVYTGLAFFRQLPAGVAGAYRLFANLISLRSTIGAGGDERQKR